VSRTFAACWCCILIPSFEHHVLAQTNNHKQAYLERLFEVTILFKKNSEIDDYLRVGDLQVQNSIVDCLGGL
jgi:hypothetical protein